MEAKKCADDVFDLILEMLPTGDYLTLSSKYSSAGAEDNRLMYQDIATLEMKVGTTVTAMCLAIDDQNASLKLIPDDNMSENMVEITSNIAECLKTCTEAYSPIVDELCLAKFDGEWYRAAVLNVNEALDVFDVYYIDFGNTASVPSSDIRKISVECSKFPALVLTGYLKEITDNSNEVTQSVLDIIKSEIFVGEPYAVEVLKKLEKSEYLVQIPSLSTKLV